MKGMTIASSMWSRTSFRIISHGISCRAIFIKGVTVALRMGSTYTFFGYLDCEGTIVCTGSSLQGLAICIARQMRDNVVRALGRYDLVMFAGSCFLQVFL